MDTPSKTDLINQAIELAANIKEEDLKNPETYALVEQLLKVLDTKPSKLPKDLVAQLEEIQDPKERFAQAVNATGAQGDDALDSLAADMKNSGLLKTVPADISKSHILMFPASINGKLDHANSDQEFHTTLKWLGNSHSDALDNKKIQEVVDRHQVHPPKDFEIEPHVFNTARGEVHVLKLKDTHKGMEYAHHELSEDDPDQYKFTPHITISKGLHDEIKSKGLNAKDLDIKFKPLEYRVGSETKQRFVPAPQANQHVTSKENMDNSKLLKKAEALIKKISKDLDKGQDENGNPIRGSNKRLQQAKVFGTKSDVKVDKQGTQHYKIPDANGKRTSPQRMKMMNTIKDYADKKMGAKMVVAEGKRDESGKLKNKAPIEKEPFDVFTAKGHAEEKARQGKIDAHNSSLKPGQKPIKRVDPKPDHRSGNLETQPSPDAAIHEIAHEALAPKHMSMADHQTHMDKQWGESQSKYGHMQQKKTAGEVQPMAAENPIRREMGLPANRTFQAVKDPKKPVEQTVDGTGPRFNRGKDKKGAPVDYMRQSKLLSPENKERINQLRDGRLKHTPEGIKEGTSIDAKINARRAAEKPKEAPKKEMMPEKLAASEFALSPGQSFNSIKYQEANTRMHPEANRTSLKGQLKKG